MERHTYSAEQQLVNFYNKGLDSHSLPGDLTRESLRHISLLLLNVLQSTLSTRYHLLARRKIRFISVTVSVAVTISVMCDNFVWHLKLEDRAQHCGTFAVNVAQYREASKERRLGGIIPRRLSASAGRSLRTEAANHNVKKKKKNTRELAFYFARIFLTTFNLNAPTKWRSWFLRAN